MSNIPSDIRYVWATFFPCGEGDFGCQRLCFYLTSFSAEICSIFATLLFFLFDIFYQCVYPCGVEPIRLPFFKTWRNFSLFRCPPFTHSREARVIKGGPIVTIVISKLDLCNENVMSWTSLWGGLLALASLRRWVIFHRKTRLFSGRVRWTWCLATTGFPVAF